jgi:hypothetical protein
VFFFGCHGNGGHFENSESSLRIKMPAVVMETAKTLNLTQR